VKRELLRGNWSLFTVSRRRQTATYTHGCEDWRREDEEEQRERGEREVVRRVQLRGKTMNAVDSKRDGPYERPTRFSANERPSKESFIRQTSIPCRQRPGRPNFHPMSSAWQPLQQPADCLCVVSGHFLLGIVHTRQLLIRFPLVLVLRLFNTCGSLCLLCFSFCIMSRYLQLFFITDDGHCTTIIRSWPASCSTLVSYHRYCQHNGW